MPLQERGGAQWGIRRGRFHNKRGKLCLCCSNQSKVKAVTLAVDECMRLEIVIPHFNHARYNNLPQVFVQNTVKVTGVKSQMSLLHQFPCRTALLQKCVRRNLVIRLPAINTAVSCRKILAYRRGLVGLGSQCHRQEGGRAREVLPRRKRPVGAIIRWRM